MDLSEFAFGTASVGSRIRYPRFERLADAAWQAGVTRFDCAPQYGRGLAMQYIARYLSARPDHPARVCTKLGRLPVGDPKSLALVLSQLEWRHALRLWRTPRSASLDFSEPQLRHCLNVSLQWLTPQRLETLFIHSSPKPFLEGGGAQALLGLCRAGWQPGLAEPCQQDLDWLEQHTPQQWSLQISAAQLLTQPALAAFPGKLWINSIIRYTRQSGLSLQDTMAQLCAARPVRRTFVVGFNHTQLFDAFAAL